MHLSLNLFLIYIVAYCSTFNIDTKFPIIFNKFDQPGSHFGYNVQFHRSNSTNRMWLIIAAPKANSSIMPHEVIEPGAIFSCTLNSGSCSELKLDVTGNNNSDYTKEFFSYKDLKNHMFLGGSMDSGHGNFMACAHLWKNAMHKKLYLSNGLCYIINENLEDSAARLTPLVDRQQQAVDGVYKFAFGLAGMSSAFTDNGILLGAPGVQNYVGSNVFYEVDVYGEPYRITNPTTPEVIRSLVPDSYFGYSVASGRFYGSDLSYVSGAPKMNETGRVYIYSALAYNVGSFRVLEVVKGVQVGEYFGSTICVSNVNGDNYDDLFVASPFYTTKGVGDHGRVYYYSSDGNRLNLVHELIGNKKPNSRFGSAISAIGDVNHDGFRDIVVGAPYEDGVGAVYIYHGSEYGIRQSHDQHIMASDINRSLRGFGISIARGDDIDGNQYNDLLIGSYLSDQAVLLRTRPVAQVSAYIKFNVPFLDLNKTSCFYQGVPQPCFEAQIFIKYSGKHVPRNLEFDLLLEMDTIRKQSLRDTRGYMLHEDQKVTEVQLTKTLQKDKEMFLSFETHIYKSARDILMPIQFKLTFNIKNRTEDRFLANHPLLDNKLRNSVTNHLLLQTNCGDDNICNADLQLDIGVLNMEDGFKGVIIGHSQDVEVYIDIKNLNETAISSVVELEFQKDVEFKNIGGCQLPKESSDGAQFNKNTRTTKSLFCQAVPVLKKNEKERFVIQLNIVKFKPKSKLIITGNVKTRSVEKILDNNKAELRLPVIALADVTIRGNTKVSQITYDDKHYKKVKHADITHSYEIFKKEVSPIDVVKLSLVFPHRSKDNVQLIKFKSVKVDDDSSSVSGRCQTSVLPFVRKQVTDDGSDITDIRKGSKSAKLTADDIDEQKLSGRGREKRSVTTVAPEKLKDFKKIEISGTILNCTNAKCIAIDCYFGPFIDNIKTGKIDIEFRVDIPSLVRLPFLKKGDTIKLQTSGKVIIKDREITLPSPDAKKTDSVITVFLSNKSPESKPVALWIIIVSVIAGILVLLIILLILVKVGFFKRKVKEDMEKLKAKAEIAEWEKLVDPPPAAV